MQIDWLRWMRIMEAFVLFCVIHTALRIRIVGPRFILRRVCWVPSNWKSQPEGGIQDSKVIDIDRVIKKVVDAIQIAALIIPVESLCLPRSIVLYMMLNRRLDNIEFCIGIEGLSLRSHAWVRCMGIDIETMQTTSMDFQVRGLTRLRPIGDFHMRNNLRSDD